MFIGCILLVPIRIILIILSLLNTYIIARILVCGDHDHAEVEYNTCKRVFTKFMIKWSMRLALFAGGGLWIKKKYYKISDFDPTYPE